MVMKMEELTVSEKLDLNEILTKASPLGDAEKPLRVCFICSGNTCRSPMAAAVLNALGKGRYIASSAGISAINGDSISENAVTALENAGIKSVPGNDYRSHFARRVTEETLRDCDMAVAISGAHLISLLCAFPAYAEKLSVMKRDISDPYMLGEAEYEKCLAEITECIKEMFLL